MQSQPRRLSAIMGESVVQECDNFLKITGEFLRENVECHFNWDLEKLDTKYFPVLENFEAKLRDKDLIVETPWILKWTLRLSFAYEKFKIHKNAGLEIMKKAVEEMESTQDSLFMKYKVAFRHVACSLQAIMLLETDWDTDQLYDLIPKIKVLDDMSDEEKSGVLGLKANVLRWYGPDGTKATIPVIAEASSLHPEEFEWKISQAIAYTRMRRQSRNPSLADVAVPKEILEDLIKRKDVFGDQDVTCKYFLAVTLKDLILMQEIGSEEKAKYSADLKKLCSEILSTTTTSPQVLSFCAEQVARNGQLSLGISIVEKLLKEFPRHIGLNTIMSNLFKKAKKFEKVLEHSKIAFEEGGYGAAWIYLECIVKRKEYLDFEEFFNKILNQHPSSYTVKTHVQAALFYYFKRKNVPKGSYHTGLALETDPSDGCITYCKGVWNMKHVNLLEIAYNQIHTYLHSGKISQRERNRLQDVQQKISVHADVTSFVTSKDLVHDMLKESRQSSLEWHQRKSSQN